MPATPWKLSGTNPPKLTKAVRQILQGIPRYAVEARLEVQVIAGGRAGGADPADHLAPAHVLADADQDRRLMPIAGLEGVPVDPSVVDAGVVAVAVAPAGPDHVPG